MSAAISVEGEMPHRTGKFIACCVLVMLFAPISRAATVPDLWLYCAANLLPDENIPKLQEVWTRAAAAGYTHVLLADSKFAKLDDLESNRDRYFAHIAQVKRIAADLHLQLVPALFDIGYSNDLLWHDPNLAEGLPVKDALFVVHDGKAQIVADPRVSLGKPHWHDDVFSIADGVASASNFPGNARLVWQLNVPRFRCYHVSCWIKSDHFSSRPALVALADDRNLQYENLPFNATQDWTRCDVVFNSLNHTNVSIYLGVWGGGQGSISIRDWKIEEAGLVNVLRRPGAPCVVRADTGDTNYVERRDYEPIVDPLMGDKPWAGAYTSWHTPPAIVTHLPEGTRLRVSWYHPAIIYDGQVSICFEEPATKKLLVTQARLMKQAWGTAGYMMSHDELRTLGWDPSCLATKQSPGAMLADNLRYCTDLLQGSQPYVWSDMFDPFQNAVNHYYLVNGDLAGSWNGLSRNVIVVNWNFGKRDQSLRFFADRGNKQVIAGYYDGDVAQVKQWLASAAKVKGVVGVMYTTWQGNYADIEEFARTVKASTNAVP
jgi:hypothetical protein